MTCPDCQTKGRYNFACLDCCVRLVLSTRPNKAQASVMLDTIKRFRDAPSREQILEKVKERL